MRHETTGKDGDWKRVRGDQDVVSVKYDNTGIDFAANKECFGIGPGYFRLRNAATASLPASPAEGALIWDSTEKVIKVWNGSSYEILSATAFGYEADQWTPVISDGTNDATHSVQAGYYERMGRRVFFNYRAVVTSKGSISGALRVSGLPYPTADGTTNHHGAGYVGLCTGASITAGQSIAGRIPHNGSSFILLKLWDATTGTTDLQDSEITDSFQIEMSGHYMAAI